jgi:2',3'-cyclic-nucleotide 2'-phosphodiesterase
MLKILFIGDVSGRVGRKTLAKIVPKLKSKYHIDTVIANVENIAHGSGVTEDTLKDVQAAGVDYMTVGDHAFKAKIDVFDKFPVIRPANYSPQAPGQGFIVFQVKGYKILLISLIGRTFMKMDHECPFHKIDEILANPSLSVKSLSAIIIDIHAEATSEKISLKYYLDGRVSAVLGTHTHIPTADQEITKLGTAYITDVGMTGFAEGCLGIDKENIIKTFLTQIPYSRKIPEKGPAIFSAVLLTVNPKTAKAEAIKQIIEKINIT